MPALKNDKFREYTRYAEYCLNMVVSTRDQELRCAQREMAAEYAFQGPQRPHFVTKQRMRSCCFALVPMRWPWCRCASSPASQEPSSSGPEPSELERRCHSRPD